MTSSADPVVGGAQRIRGLDGIRGVAAVVIGCYHAYFLGGRPSIGSSTGLQALGAGYLAVDVFFVLSGLVLFLPMARRGGQSRDYREFLVRRFTRLWPCCLLAIAGGLLIHSWLGISLPPSPLSGQGWLPFIGNVTLLSPMTNGYGSYLGYGVDPVVWSLAIEVCFSLTLPFVAGVFWRHPHRGLAVAVIASRAWILAVTQLGPGSQPAQQLTPVWRAGQRLVVSYPTYLAHFALGMWLACVVVRHGPALTRSLGERGVACMFGLGLVGSITATALLGHEQFRQATGYDRWTRSWPLLIALALLLLGASLADGVLARVLSGGPARLLADASYPFYLLHVIVITLVLNNDQLPGGWSRVGLAFLSLPVAFVLALLMHRYVEEPFTNLGRNLKFPINRLTDRVH